jgi:hypothetical protein
VLVLGSVGTVSAVHLDAAHVPAGPDGRSSSAMAPPALPDTRSTTPDLWTPSVEEQTPPARSRGARAATRRSSHAADRPVTGRDLIDMAKGPRRADSVVVPAHVIERTVPLRSTVGVGRRDVLGGHLRSLDDVIDLDYSRPSRRGQNALGSRTVARGYNTNYNNNNNYNNYNNNYNPNFDGPGYDRGDYDRGDYDRADNSRVGFHRADVRWDSDDVSYSRSRCGRHRA